MVGMKGKFEWRLSLLPGRLVELGEGKGEIRAGWLLEA